MFNIYYDTEGGGGSGDEPTADNFDDIANEIEEELKPEEVEEGKELEEGKEIIEEEEEETEVEVSPYEELFASPDQAREIIQQARFFEQLSGTILGGSSQELLTELSQHEDTEAIARFSTNFLPSLQKVDSDLYDRVTAPVITSLLSAALRDSDIHSNNNLKNAVVLLAKYAFGRAELPDIKPLEVRKFSRRQENREERRPDNSQAQSFELNTLPEMIGGAKSKVLEKLTSRYPNEEIRDAVADKVMRRIGSELTKDSKHISRMNSLWRRAQAEGFNISSQKRLVDTYINSAYSKLPIALKLIGKTNNAQSSQKEAGRGSSSGTGKIDTSKIDWTKTTTKDYLDRKITYKK